jgi:Lrp/AsnC family transcriptional regulator for asnA, asnC and gidA
MQASQVNELDDVDHKILRELQHDARISFKTIAQKVGVSEATIFVRVRKMQEKGVIKGFTTLVVPAAVGKPLTAIVLVRANPKAYAGTLDALKKIDAIYEIYDVTGQYYCILKIRASGTEELGNIMDEVGRIDGIAGTETIVVLRTVKEDVTVRV